MRILNRECQDENNVRIQIDDIVNWKVYLGTSIIPHLDGWDEHYEHFSEKIFKAINREGELILINDVDKEIYVKEISKSDLEIIGNMKIDSSFYDCYVNFQNF